ncbi:hypothetical protein COL940_002548 [Colletotrichum noveboracense]|nr:hypothetical protein COL940_002548 [Colletotrichum noveboracense]
MELNTYTYKHLQGADPIEADVYFKHGNSSSTKPIAIYYHGGNFVVGDKGMISPQYIKVLLDLGFGAVVSPNYRLSPTISAYDGAIEDSKDAFSWVQNDLPVKLANDAGIMLDGERVVTWGHSAGGTLALLMASMPKPPKAILDLFGLKYMEDESFAEPAKIPPMDLPDVETADVILVLDCDVPWIPTRCKPRTDACVIHVDVDPLKHNMPVFYINAQHRYQANAFVAVTQINDYIASNDEILSVITSPLYAMRPLGLQEAHANRMIRIAGEAKPSTEGFFGTPNLMDQLQEAVPKNTIFVVEAITNTQSVAEQLRLTTPGS